MLTFVRGIDKLRAEYRCDCGVVKSFYRQNVRSGASKSCGCWRKARGHIANLKHGCKTVALTKPVYRSWVDMKKRCYNERHKSFQNYGGRGIIVCERWRESFENFYADMGDRPTGCTLERNDVNRNYEPDNCRWATHREQGLNKRNNVRYEAFGKSLTLGEWSDETGIARLTILMRIKRGATVEDALTRPVNIRKGWNRKKPIA
jgi:predicted small secreted protein